MNITHISVLSVPVKNQDVAKAFYTEKLEFRVLRDDTFGSQRWVQLVPEGGQTSITLITEGMTPGSQRGLILATRDIRADYETLKTRGVVLAALQEMPWGISATFTDPDGNGWVLQQFAR
jgi:predicted enzyme related to lactoylglutathione lyase